MIWTEFGIHTTWPQKLGRRLFFGKEFHEIWHENNQTWNRPICIMMFYLIFFLSAAHTDEETFHQGPYSFQNLMLDHSSTLQWYHLNIYPPKFTLMTTLYMSHKFLYEINILNISYIVIKCRKSNMHIIGSRKHVKIRK